MANRHVFRAVPSTWRVEVKRFNPPSTTYVTAGAALVHELYGNNGYVGPKSKVKPLPPHAFDSYYDHIVADEDYKRVYLDGRGYDQGIGPCLHASPHSVEFFPAIDYSNVYARALDKLTDEVRGGLDLSVDLLQAGQVVRMFNVRKRIIDFTRTFTERVHFRTRTRRSEDYAFTRYMASARLEYMYGVKPLIGSLFGAADEMLRHVINETARFKVSATDRGYKPSEFGVSMYYGMQRFNGAVLDCKVSTRLGVDVRTDQFDISRWTSLNPVSIAWELMPYSFVVDWFLNIGGYLRNMETYLLNASKFRSGYRTNFVAFQGTAEAQLGVPSDSSGGDKITVTVNGWRILRSTLTEYPIPQLPSIQAELGSSRLLNGAALLAQFLPVGRKTIRPWTGD